jgi:hypothetical protein
MPRPTSVRALAVSAMLLAIVTACAGSAGSTTSPGPSVASAGTPSPAPTSAATAAPSLSTTGRVEVLDEGFAITLPSGWSRIPIDRTSLDAFTKQLPPDSDLAKIMLSQAGQMASAGIKLWAMDVSPNAVVNGFTPNLNVITQPATGVTLDFLSSMAKAQLDAVSAISGTTMESVKIPAGDAVKATYALHQALASGAAVDVAGTQYYVLGPSRLYILSFSCPANDGGGCATDVDAMIQTLSLT